MCVRLNAGMCALVYGMTVLAAPATGSAQILTSGSAVNRSDPASATGAPLTTPPQTAPNTVPDATAGGSGPTTAAAESPEQTTAPTDAKPSLWGRLKGTPQTSTPPETATGPAPSTESISGWRPLIDTKGVNAARYEADLSDCQAFASQNREADRANVKRSAVKSGLLTGGAAVAITVLTGGVAILPMMAGSLAGAAGLGALSGAAGGAVVADAAWRGTVSSCLGGRGYKVLN